MSLKILFIADGMTPFTIGGMQRHSQNLVKHLLKENDVHVCLGFTVEKNENIPTKEEVFESLDYQEGKGNLSYKVFKFDPVKNLPGHYVRSSKEMSERIYKAFESDLGNLDVVYCKGLLGWEFTKRRKRGELSIPVVVNLHGYEMFQKAPNLKIKIQHVLLLRKVTRTILDNADFVVSYGAKITTLLESIGYSKIIEIPSGVTDEWIVDDTTQTNLDRIKVVFLGRFERRKGVQEINEMINQHNQELQDKIDFHFIGPIPEEVRIQGSNVIYHGAIRDVEQIKALLDQMDVLLCPSYSEGMPNVILEGMSRGLAVVATDVGAVSLLVGDDNGVLLPGPSSEKLYEVLLGLNRENVNKLRSSSLQKIKKFRWSEIAKQTILKLKEVADEAN